MASIELRGEIYYIRWRENGQTRAKSLRTGSKKHAEKKLSQFEAERAPGQRIPPAEAYARWLRFKEHIDAVVPETIRSYREKLDAIFAAWDRVPMHKWRRSMLEDYLVSRKTMGRNSKRALLSILKSWRRWAVDNGIDVADFIGNMRIRREPARRMSTLTLDQVQAVLEQARQHADGEASHHHAPYMEAPVALAAYAGLSLGDIVSLDWREVDLKEAWITRPRQKTGVDLDIPIVPPLREILLRAHMKQGRPRSGQVCAGMPPNKSALSKPLHSLQRAAGIKPAPQGENGWHRYRRSLGTNLMRLGTPLPVVAAILGHAHGSISTLLYEIPDRSDVEEAMRRYGTALE